MLAPELKPIGLDICNPEDERKEFLLCRRITEGTLGLHNPSAACEQQVKNPDRLVAVDGLRGKATALSHKLHNVGSTVVLAFSQAIG